MFEHELGSLFGACSVSIQGWMRAQTLTFRCAGDLNERVICLFSIMRPTSAVWIDDVVT